jgi:hypothetical protein
MRRTLGRALWSILAYDRPTWWGDYAALAALAGLVVLGALILGWPWVSEAVVRVVADGMTLVRVGFDRLVEWLRGALPRLG